MTDWYAPNQQAVRPDGSGPAEEGTGGSTRDDEGGQPKPQQQPPQPEPPAQQQQPERKAPERTGRRKSGSEES